MPATFIQIPFDAIDHILKHPKLPGNVFRLWLYLQKLDPFGDRGLRMPTIAQIAHELEISYDTVRRAIEKLEELGLIKIDHDKCKTFWNGVKNLKNLSQRIRNKIFCSPQECEPNRTDADIGAPMRTELHGCEIDELKLLPDKDCGASQTIQKIYKPQTKGEVEKKFKSEKAHGVTTYLKG